MHPIPPELISSLPPQKVSRVVQSSQGSGGPLLKENDK